MKKALYIAFALVMLAGSAATAQQRFDATVFGGATFNQIDGDDAGGYTHLGLRGGVGTSFYLGWDERTPWRLVVELAYVQKGSNIENDLLQRRISLDYVELPVMMSYTMLGGSLRLAAGVAPAVMVGAVVVDGGGERNAIQEARYRRFDWLPLTFSARYLFTYDVAVELRFQTTMVSMYDGSGPYRIFSANHGAFNRQLSLGLAYCF